MNQHLCPADPRRDGKHHGTQERKRRPGRIQSSKPPAQRRGIGHVIRIFDGGRRIFPRTSFHEIAVQRLAAGDEAVVAVGRREGRQERKRLPAPVAKAAPNRNPIVMFVMSLFAAAAMTDDGVLVADRASAQDDVGAGFGPIGIGIDLPGGKWDNENRSKGALPGPVTLPRSGPERSLTSQVKESQLEKNSAFPWRLSVRAARGLAG